MLAAWVFHGEEPWWQYVLALGLFIVADMLASYAWAGRIRFWIREDM
jgi:hypothetical protein